MTKSAVTTMSGISATARFLKGFSDTLSILLKKIMPARAVSGCKDNVFFVKRGV